MAVLLAPMATAPAPVAVLGSPMATAPLPDASWPSPTATAPVPLAVLPMLWNAWVPVPATTSPAPLTPETAASSWARLTASVFPVPGATLISRRSAPGAPKEATMAWPASVLPAPRTIEPAPNDCAPVPMATPSPPLARVWIPPLAPPTTPVELPMAMLPAV